MIYKIFLILVIVLSVSGCNKKDEEDLTPNVTPAHLVLTSYPSTPGNSWKYHTEVRLTDSSGVIIDSTIYDNYWTAVSDTSINGIASTKFSQLDSNYTGSVHLAYSYYANQTDGFYGMAVENSGPLFFLKSGIKNIKPVDIFSVLNLMSTDSLFIPDTSLQLLKFPSANNDTWRSHEYDPQTIIRRRWIGNTNVSTVAGTFNCMKLQIFWDNDNNSVQDDSTLTIFQYFSVKGLIKETRFGRFTSPGGGTETLNQTTTLIHLNF